MNSTESYLHSEEGRALYRRRVRQFAVVCFAIGISFYFYRLALETYVHVGSPFEPSMVAHLAGSTAFGALWIATALGPASTRYVQTVEAVGLLASCIGYESMGRYIPITGGAWLAVILALTYTFVARSAFVPSRPRTTFLLTTAAGVPLVYLAYGSYVEWAPTLRNMVEQYPLIMGQSTPGSLLTVVVGNAATIAMWWMTTVALCTFISRVIYGLRHDAFTAQKLGQYTLEEEIGAGGMGQVYRASHALLRRPCAVKVLTPDKAGEANIARFEREVQLTAQLTHPNTVTIFDYGRTVDGLFYYAMELLDGADLQTIVDSTGRFEPARVGQVLRQVAGALAEAHGLGLIHRDVKPSNIILSDRGGLPDVAKIVDFGLVKRIEAAEPTVTMANVITGTPLYMSPETITAPDKLDARRDLYSLGAVGYYLLTGTRVFAGATPVEVCSHHLHTQPTPPSARLGHPVPIVLESLLMRCLEKDPAKRPQSAAELEAVLASSVEMKEWSVDRARRWWNENSRLRLANRRALPPHVAKAAVRGKVGAIGRTDPAPEEQGWRLPGQAGSKTSTFAASRH